MRLFQKGKKQLTSPLLTGTHQVSAPAWKLPHSSSTKAELTRDKINKESFREEARKEKAIVPSIKVCLRVEDI